MRTHIIAVACKKGGTGKTTTTMMLSGELVKRGYKVVVFDTDNTEGATIWEDYVYEDGKQLPFPVEPMNLHGLNRERLMARYPDTWLMIDTPASSMDVIQRAMDISDVTIVPTQPGVADRRQAGMTYQAAKRAVVLLTRMRRGTKLSEDAIHELDGSEITRFETVVHEREAIRRMYGTTDTDNEEYASVASELIDYVTAMDKLNEGKED